MSDLNYLLTSFLILYLVQIVFDTVLEKTNLQHMRRAGQQTPKSFEGFVDASTLSRSVAYTTEKTRLNLFAGLVADILLLALIVTGVLSTLDAFLAKHALPLIPSALLFFSVPALLLYLVGLSFDYIRVFRIEEKFGFNRSSLRIWMTDHLKSGLLSVVLSSLVLSLILWMIRLSPQNWWIWGFFIVSLLQTTVVLLYPVLIAPLFNEFRPVADEQLANRIMKLMDKSGIKIKKILQMDAGLRSRHTNAYFTGLGRTKQIVLFDTLIRSHPHSEILAVLAHELGHFTKKHIIKQLFLFEVFVLSGFYLTHHLLDRPVLYSAFGFGTPKSYVGLFFIGIFLQKAGYFLKPLYMALSRYFERQADLFAAEMTGDGAVLAVALKRMAADNLVNLWPHGLYVWFNYSHPPLIERVARLESENPTKVPSTHVTEVNQC